ncbi:undecaprenyl-diphosphate phosphatase [Ignavibacteriales bacterium]
MSILEAIILGIVQGITEFLPISSTAHLTITGKMLGLINSNKPEEWTAIIAIIQLGTLASILIYFAKDIYNIVVEFFRDNLVARKSFKQQSLNSRLGWLVIIGTIPVVVIGLGFKDIIEGALTKNLFVIATSLIVLAIILFIAEKTAKFKKGIEDVGVKEAIVIGIAQAFALIPGSSRSGTTITGGLFMGMNREAAARFSFLLSIPAIFASGLLQLKEGLKFLNSEYFLAIGVATVVSGISGYLAIDFLLKFLKKNSTNLFIVYRIAAGLIILALLATKIITP